MTWRPQSNGAIDLRLVFDETMSSNEGFGFTYAVATSGAVNTFAANDLVDTLAITSTVNGVPNPHLGDDAARLGWSWLRVPTIAAQGVVRIIRAKE